MQILELLFLINGLSEVSWLFNVTINDISVIYVTGIMDLVNVNGHLFVHDICNFCIIYPHFDISKTDKILQNLSQFSRKFLQIFLGNRFTCMLQEFLYQTM